MQALLTRLGSSVLILVIGIGIGWRLANNHYKAQQADAQAQVINQVKLDDQKRQDTSLHIIAKQTDYIKKQDKVTENVKKSLELNPISSECVYSSDSMRQLNQAINTANSFKSSR